MSFRVGDRVITNAPGFSWSGQSGEVLAVDLSAVEGCRYHVDLERSGPMPVYARELSAAPAISRGADGDKPDNTAPRSAGAALVHGDRADDYGSPIESFKRIAALWSAIIGTEITSHDVALMMIAFKVSREKGKPKPDNLTDIEGYVECARLITEEQK